MFLTKHILSGLPIDPATITVLIASAVPQVVPGQLLLTTTAIPAPTITSSSVPEPAVMQLLGGALVALLFLKRHSFRFFPAQ